MVDEKPPMRVRDLLESRRYLHLVAMDVCGCTLGPSPSKLTVTGVKVTMTGCDALLVSGSRETYRACAESHRLPEASCHPPSADSVCK